MIQYLTWIIYGLAGLLLMRTPFKQFKIAMATNTNTAKSFFPHGLASLLLCVLSPWMARASWYHDPAFPYLNLGCSICLLVIGAVSYRTYFIKTIS